MSCATLLPIISIMNSILTFVVGLLVFYLPVIKIKNKNGTNIYLNCLQNIFKYIKYLSNMNFIK